MNNREKITYKDMLPKEEKAGKLGYYPVSNYEEWETLPDLYKTMEWEPVKDPHNTKMRSAVKAVIFDVPFIEPYGIRGKVSVHPQDVQKILFCLFKDTQCHLYTISAVELENGRRIPAEWLQDSILGAFCIKAGGEYIAKQGGFGGFIPEHINKTEDGSFKFDFRYGEGKTTHYTLLNPFRNELVKGKDFPNNTLNEKIDRAASKSNMRNNQDIQIQKTDKSIE